MASYSAQYTAFRKRLRKAREAAGLSQAEAARRLMKPQSFISKCELGERRVDVIEVVAFAKLYRVGVAFFLPEDP